MDDQINHIEPIPPLKPKKKVIPPPRVDKTEYMRRIFAIQGWIMEGVQSALIIRDVLENRKWCQSRRHAERMLKEARELWASVPEAEIEVKRKLYISKLEQQKRSLKEKYKGTPAGIRACTAIDKLIIEMEGLMRPQKIELTGKNGQPIQSENTQVLFYIPKNGREPKDN